MKTYCSDSEYRILLAALGRERKLCEKIEKEFTGTVNLIDIMNSIDKKIRSIQYGK